MDIEPANNFIDAKIYTVRGQSVMLDSDLAAIYGVDTATLNRTVGRHPRRFPKSLAFWLTRSEWKGLYPHDTQRRAIRVFNPVGAIMLAFVLQSPEAVAASIRIVKAVVEQYDHPLASLFGEAFGNIPVATEHDDISGTAFHILPSLVAIDKQGGMQSKRRHGPGNGLQRGDRKMQGDHIADMRKLVHDERIFSGRKSESAGCRNTRRLLTAPPWSESGAAHYSCRLL